jgi:peptidyl-prolyl cis-trans isomerase C
MTTAKHLFAGAAMLLSVTLPANAQDSTPAPEVNAGTVVATVDGIEITLGHMIVMRARLPAEYQAAPPEQLFPAILDQLIQQTALSERMEGELSLGSQLALDNERRAFRAGEAVNAATANAVSDEAIAAYYAENYTGADPEQEYNAAHILVETEEEAKAIKAELDGGADFATLAREKSTGPSGPNAGDLGWFTKGMMVEPFEAAVLTLEAGQISEPVQTQFGWHVIQLKEVRFKEAPPLDTVRGEIVQSLQRAAIEKAISDATGAAEIVRSSDGIDPAVLSDMSIVLE